MLNFALIGCGRISERHSQLLGNNEISEAKLVAVCDVELKKAKRLAKKYNVPFFKDMDEMMTEVDIDVIVVLTPSGNHASNVINLAKYEKDIVVEKPMALTIEDADEMIKACNENNCKLFVVKQNRFNLPVIKLREAVEQNRLGKIFLGTVRIRWARHQSYYDQDNWRGTWKMDGGVLTNQASHHVDLLEWMLGEVESVLAKSITALADIEVEDTAAVILKFKSGALGIIEATTASRPNDLEGSLSLMGDKGSVVIEGFSVNKIKTWSFKDMKKSDEDILDNFSENPPNVYGFGHKSYYENVVSCINNGTPNKVDGAEGRKSLELINAIYEAIETRKEVFIDSCSKKSKLGRN
tara:strand:- start:4058 stop:5116 length:1059 start_codon:yes stop_codon:yes gene_type:complete